MDRLRLSIYNLQYGNIQIEYTRENEILLALLYPNLVKAYPIWGEMYRIEKELDRVDEVKGLLKKIVYFIGFSEFLTTTQKNLTGVETNFLSASLDSEADSESIIPEEYWLPALNLIKSSGAKLAVRYENFSRSLYIYDNNTGDDFKVIPADNLSYIYSH
jgi:hypothetical protein